MVSILFTLVAAALCVSGCELEDRKQQASVAVAAFVDDVRTKRFERAYQRTSADYRQAASAAEFERAIAANVYWQEATGFRSEVVTQLGAGRYKVSGVLLSGGEVAATADVVFEGKSPKVAGFASPAEPLLPSPRAPASPPSDPGNR